MTKKTFYITTPIYYPSGQLHIGHAYTTTLAWIMKNYKSMQGYDAVMLTGADEHGQKIEEKASQNNLSPQAYVDKMDKLFKDLWSKLDIDYDFYSRTTNEQHQKSVQRQFAFLKEKGLIYKGEYKGLYSVQDEEFLTKTQASLQDGKYYHPTSNHELQEVKEESYFFKMAQFSEWLINYYDQHPDFIVPHKIKKELLNNFLNKGLEDLSISRSSFEWGIKIPGNDKHVVYVWLDALNNYITTLGYNSINESNFNKYWKNGDEVVHIVGKEITRFHCIYWPIILQASELRQPSHILSHGWIITPEGKMSKSKGNVVDPMKLIEKYGFEQLKYFLATKIKTGQDGTFDETSFKEVLNADLANNFGNLLSRTVAMHNQNFDQAVKYDDQKLIAADLEIFDLIKNTREKFISAMDSMQISTAYESVLHLSKSLNGYIDITKPWLLKDDLPRLEVVINALLNGIYSVAVFLSLILPQKMEYVFKSLAIKKKDLEAVGNFSKFDDIIPQKIPPLFERIK